MPRSISCRPLLALPLMVPLFGCANTPPPRPVVLRPPPPATERYVAHRPVPRRKPAAETVSRDSATTPASSRTPDQRGEASAALSPTDREELFREFDDYLSRSGRE
jgi:hypothetical protein